MLAAAVAATRAPSWTLSPGHKPGSGLRSLSSANTAPWSRLRNPAEQESSPSSTAASTARSCSATSAGSARSVPAPLVMARFGGTGRTAHPHQLQLPSRS